MKSTIKTTLLLTCLVLLNMTNIDAQKLNFDKSNFDKAWSTYQSTDLRADLSDQFDLEPRITDACIKELAAFFSLDRKSQSSYINAATNKLVKNKHLKKREAKLLQKMFKAACNGPLMNQT